MAIPRAMTSVTRRVPYAGRLTDRPHITRLLVHLGFQPERGERVMRTPWVSIHEVRRLNPHTQRPRGSCHSFWSRHEHELREVLVEAHDRYRALAKAMRTDLTENHEQAVALNVDVGPRAASLRAQGNRTVRLRRSTMDDIRQRLDQDLKTALFRLRQIGGALAVAERPCASGDNSPCADEVDEIQISANREIGLLTRAMLVDRVNRLSDALDRLNDGAYGVCVDCDEPISPARLHVMPEVQTCVRCQDGIERPGRSVEPFASATTRGSRSA